jgi:hypothetical protein
MCFLPAPWCDGSSRMGKEYGWSRACGSAPGKGPSTIHRTPYQGQGSSFSRLSHWRVASTGGSIAEQTIWLAPGLRASTRREPMTFHRTPHRTKVFYHGLDNRSVTESSARSRLISQCEPTHSAIKRVELEMQILNKPWHGTCGKISRRLGEAAGSTRRTNSGRLFAVNAKHVYRPADWSGLPLIALWVPSTASGFSQGGVAYAIRNGIGRGRSDPPPILQNLRETRSEPAVDPIYHVLR